jgi:hypothetical protein
MKTFMRKTNHSSVTESLLEWKTYFKAQESLLGESSFMEWSSKESSSTASRKVDVSRVKEQKGCSNPHGGLSRNSSRIFVVSREEKSLRHPA